MVLKNSLKTIHGAQFGCRLGTKRQISSPLDYGKDILLRTDTKGLFVAKIFDFSESYIDYITIYKKLLLVSSVMQLIVLSAEALFIFNQNEYLQSLQDQDELYIRYMYEETFKRQQLQDIRG